MFHTPRTSNTVFPVNDAWKGAYALEPGQKSFSLSLSLHVSPVPKAATIVLSTPRLRMSTGHTGEKRFHLGTWWFRITWPFAFISQVSSKLAVWLATVVKLDSFWEVASLANFARCFLSDLSWRTLFSSNSEYTYRSSSTHARQTNPCSSLSSRPTGHVKSLTW